MVKKLPAGIVKETKPLSEDFLPQSFPGREQALSQLLDCLSPAAREGKPTHAWLHGPPGSGKTALAKRALAQLEEQGVGTAYVNCWGAQTFYGTLEKVFQELRALVAEQRDVSFKLERLSRIARQRPLVVVLDEVDQMFLREREATLYNLTNLDHAGLVCLSQSREAFLALDSRIRSRLLPKFLDLRAYSTVELVRILERRASEALVPEAWCTADLERIAQAAGGDARIAIQTLRAAAYLADKRQVPQITPEDIQEGLRISSHLRRNYFLRGLSEHHRLLYQLVQEEPGIENPRLWRRYLKEAGKRGMEPRQRRTVNHYRQFMIQNRVLEERQLGGRKNRRGLWVVDDDKNGEER